jgi:hypothetical protein
MNWYKQVGVYYCHPGDSEEPPKAGTTHTYEWRHIPTGERGVRAVTVLGGRDAACRLVNHWNNDDWQYKVVA